MFGGGYYSYQIEYLFSAVMSSVGNLFSAGMGLLTSTGLCGKGSFKARDVGGVKKLFRLVGVDQFDDFEFVLVVHDVSFEYAKKKFNTEVRVKAGEHTVVTAESSDGSFQQPFSIFVEQGTRSVRVEMVDTNRQRVVSSVDLDINKDILAAYREPVSAKLYTMTQRTKAVINPRIRLSIEVEDSEAVEAGLLPGKEEDANDFVYEPMETVAETPEQQRMIDGLQGIVERFDGQEDETVFVAVVGPPHYKRYFLAIWKDEQSFLEGKSCDDKVDLLKVRSVQPSSRGEQLFEVNYAKESAQDKRQMLFGSLDRPLDEWTGPLISLIEARHGAKAKKRQSQSA